MPPNPPPASSTKTLSSTELLARLVAFDSTSHRSNLPIADFLCDYLDLPGVRIERNPSPAGDKTNLIVTVGPEVDPGERSGLVLSGHVDVVPALEPEWESDPFRLREGEERLYGRGSCDMKGFVALAANAARRAAARRLAHPLCLVITYDEEVGTLGARHFAETWPEERPLPRKAIIGEPTSLAVVRLHKGHTKLRVGLRGKSAHSGYPHLGDNAIEPAGAVITALAELRRQLETEPCPNGEHFPEVPFVALNVATVEGGTAVNIVPDRCAIGFGFRVLPGMDSAEVTERARAAVAEALGARPFTFELLSESPPMALGEEVDLYRELTSILGQSHTVSASYATDAGWLQHRGMDCLLFGPGDIAVAHRPNEFVPRAELARAEEVLEELIGRYCEGAG